MVTAVFLILVAAAQLVTLLLTIRDLERQEDKVGELQLQLDQLRGPDPGGDRETLLQVYERLYGYRPVFLPAGIREQILSLLPAKHGGSAKDADVSEAKA